MTPGQTFGHAGGIKFPIFSASVFPQRSRSSWGKDGLGFLLRLEPSPAPRKHRLLETSHLTWLLWDQEWIRICTARGGRVLFVWALFKKGPQRGRALCQRFHRQWNIHADISAPTALKDFLHILLCTRTVSRLPQVKDGAYRQPSQVGKSREMNSMAWVVIFKFGFLFRIVLLPTLPDSLQLSLHGIKIKDCID